MGAPGINTSIVSWLPLLVSVSRGFPPLLPLLSPRRGGGVALWNSERTRGTGLCTVVIVAVLMRAGCGTRGALVGVWNCAAASTARPLPLSVVGRCDGDEPVSVASPGENAIAGSVGGLL